MAISSIFKAPFLLIWTILQKVGKWSPLLIAAIILFIGSTSEAIQQKDFGILVNDFAGKILGVDHKLYEGTQELQIDFSFWKLLNVVSSLTLMFYLFYIFYA